MHGDPLMAKGISSMHRGEVTRDLAAGKVGKGPRRFPACGRCWQGHLVATKEQGHPPPPLWCVNGVTAR